jgi:hypothetical protein
MSLEGFFCNEQTHSDIPIPVAPRPPYREALFRRKANSRYYAVLHDPWEDGDKHIDVEAIRAQLRKLPDAELIREGRAARQLVSRKGRNGKPPRRVFGVDLKNASPSGAGAIRAETGFCATTGIVAVLHCRHCGTDNTVKPDVVGILCENCGKPVYSPEFQREVKQRPQALKASWVGNAAPERQQRPGAARRGQARGSLAGLSAQRRFAIAPRSFLSWRRQANNSAAVAAGSDLFPLMP